MLSQDEGTQAEEVIQTQEINSKDCFPINYVIYNQWHGRQCKPFLLAYSQWLFWAGTMTWRAKNLMLKREYMNSGPQHPYEKLGKAACVSNPSAGVRSRERQIAGWEKGGDDLIASQPSQNGWQAADSKRDLA